MNGLNQEELFSYHYNNAHISAAQYSRLSRLTIGANIASKIKIYLDQKYWIYCRDAFLGKPQKNIHTEIYNSLIKAVGSGHVICPASYSVIAETFKQHNIQNRQATAAVIDQLASKIAVSSFNQLLEIELYHLVETHIMKKDTFPLEQLVWLPIGWVVGEVIPYSQELPQELNNAIQKCVYDDIAMMNISDIIEATNNNPLPQVQDDQICAKIREESRAHSKEVTSFDGVLKSEVAGAIDTIKLHIKSLMAHLHEKYRGIPITDNDPELLESARLIANTIGNLIILKKWSTQFPYIHIHTGIHALMRWEKRDFKSGDLWDYSHAHPALAYCNAFLTEKKLGNLLCHRLLRYDHAYNCKVMWDEEDVLEYIRSLLIE